MPLLHEVWDGVLQRFPERIAIDSPAFRWTYAALDQHSNRIAAGIQQHCPDRGRSIATFTDNAALLVAAFLAAIRTGNRYVPISTRFPAARATFLRDDSEARLLITDTSNLAGAQHLRAESCPVINADDLPRSSGAATAHADEDTLIWILYTSGSTGDPKGVTQNHRNLLQYLANYRRGFAVTEADRLMTMFSLTLNGGMHDALIALLHGATLLPWDAFHDGIAGAIPWMIERRVTIYSSAASVFRRLCASAAPETGFPDARLVRVWAESSYRKDFEAYSRHFPATCRLVNRYGGTETGSVLWWFHDHESTVETNGLPMGHAVEGNEILLDPATGEIIVKSRFLTPGYWRRPEQNAKAFQIDGDGVRYYRTGDTARQLPDGRFVHTGRCDLQVKIRGFRVEIDEVEQALVEADGVREAAVIGEPGENGETRLVAYVSAGDPKPAVNTLRNAIAEKLPEYMVPSAFVYLDELPRAPNGKLLRRGLPPPGRERPLLDTLFAAPEGPIEKAIAGIWQELLRIDGIGRDDEFLDLGGDSILAGQVAARAVEKLGRQVPIGKLLDAGTVSRMAALFA